MLEYTLLGSTGTRVFMTVGPNPTIRKPHLLLIVAGGSDSTACPLMCEQFLRWADVTAVADEIALPFINTGLLPMNVLLFTDDIWKSWSGIGLQLHQILPMWADLLVLAPVSGFIIEAIAKGVSCDLVTRIVQAWNYNKPAYVVPNLPPRLRYISLTRYCLRVLEQRGMKIVPETTVAEFDPRFICASIRLMF